MNYYLIEKDGEYRATDRWTQTRIDNETRHGWHVLACWDSATASWRWYATDDQRERATS